MYRDVFIRAYGEEEIEKIDQLRQAGVNLTELLLNAIMEYKIIEEEICVTIWYISTKPLWGMGFACYDIKITPFTSTHFK